VSVVSVLERVYPWASREVSLVEFKEQNDFMAGTTTALRLFADGSPEGRDSKQSTLAAKADPAKRDQTKMLVSGDMVKGRV